MKNRVIVNACPTELLVLNSELKAELLTFVYVINNPPHRVSKIDISFPTPIKKTNNRTDD